MAGLVSALSREHDVDVVVVRGPAADEVDARARALPVARRSRATCVLSPRPFLGNRLLDRRGVRELLDRASSSDLLLVSHSYLACAVVGSGVRVVVDLQNLETCRQVSMGGALGRWEGLKARRWEPRVVRAAEAVVAVSDADAEVARSWGARRVVVVPNVAEVPLSAPSPTEGYALAVADWTYGPNARGLSLLRELLPRFGERLVLAGKGSEAAGGLGFVDDLQALYDGAALVVSPVVSGAGTQLKVIEALTRGRVVVTTPYGAASRPSEVPEDGLVAIEVQRLGDEVNRLLASPEERHRREQLLAAAPLPRSWAAAATPLMELIRG